MFPCAREEGDLRYHWAHDHSLEILNVTRKSAGVYTVKCTNKEGETQTTIKLNVQCKTPHTLSHTHTHTHTHMNVVSSAYVARDLFVYYDRHKNNPVKILTALLQTSSHVCGAL